MSGQEDDRPSDDPSADTQTTDHSRRDRLLGIPDAEIIARFRDGDEEMFRALYLAYHKPLLRVATFLTSSPTHAEDIVSTIMLRLWRRRTEWTIRLSVESYLFNAVQHGAYNVARSQQRESAWAEIFSHDERPPGMGNALEHPETQTANSDIHDKIWNAIAGLPERTRFILILRWQQEMNFEEIAETLEMTSAAVRQVHSRALRVLREMLPEILG